MMKNKSLCLILSLFVSGCTSAANEMSPRRGEAEVRGKANASAARAQSETGRAAELAHQLQSAREAERKKAEEELLLLAGVSAESREQVIQQLMRAVEDSDARRRQESQPHYEGWQSAVMLLGELKATQAVNILVACLDCNEGLSLGLSVDRLPALKAVMMIGPEAVPKLVEALNSDRATTRQYAALALGEIGGEQAKQALRAALPRENDPGVAKIIRIALRDF